MSKSLAWIAALGLGLGVLFLSLAGAMGNGLDFLHGIDIVGETPIATGPDSRTWAWDGGDRLDVGMPAEVRLVPGGAPRVVVHGTADLIRQVQYAHGHLESARSGPSCANFMAFCHVHAHDTVLVEIQGVTLKDIDVHGVAKVNLGHIDQDRIALRISGAGDIVGDGHVGDLKVDISGAGDARLQKLAADDAEVHISGAGNAQIAPSRSADVHISGIGGVELATKPKSLSSHISGLGSVDGPDAD